MRDGLLFLTIGVIIMLSIYVGIQSSITAGMGEKIKALEKRMDKVAWVVGRADGVIKNNDKRMADLEQQDKHLDSRLHNAEYRASKLEHKTAHLPIPPIEILEPSVYQGGF